MLARTRINRETIVLLLSLPLLGLRFISCNFRDNREIQATNTTIRKIFISKMQTIDADTEKVLCNIMKSCVNVEKFRFTSISISFELALVIAYEIKASRVVCLLTHLSRQKSLQSSFFQTRSNADTSTYANCQKLNRLP
jgi:hypothetical protein